MKFEYMPGATPLDLDEINGLIPSHISTQKDLNEWEAFNILKAEGWLFSGSAQKDFLSVDFVKRLHKKMFSDTWKWAGIFRKTEKNIGVCPSNIAPSIKILLEDVHYQILHQIYSVDEIAYRFHHRLVAIHPFPNGNGRHSRLIIDSLLAHLGVKRFTWGSQKLEGEGTARKGYINALRAADKHDYAELAKFVRS
jgi:Fic-DOC domain mobile mystery protein B